MIQTVPWRSRPATRRPRPASAVHTAAGESVLGVVREGDGLVLGTEGLDGQDRPEDLLTHDTHGSVAVVQNRGPVEVPGAFGTLATGPQHRTFLQRGGHELLGPDELLLGDERTAFDTVVGAAADTDPRGAPGEFGDEAVADRLLDDQPG